MPARGVGGETHWMAYELTVVSDYAWLRYFGPTNMDEIETARPEVMRLLRTHNLIKLVVDIREVTSEFSSADARRIMAESAEVEPPRPNAAVVGRADQSAHLALIRSLSAQHGLPVRVFTELDEAVSWLSQ
jgi:hypothetical protein